MGTIRKTDSDKFQADVRHKDGKRERKVFTDKDRAEQWILMKESEKNSMKLAKAGLEMIPVPLPSLVDQAIESKKALAPKSVAKYTYVYEVFKTYIVNEKISYVADFTRSHADLFREKITTSTAAAVTKNFYLTTIKSMFEDFVKRDLILKNPFSHIKLERKKKRTVLEREQEYFNSKEISSFFAVEIEDIYRKAFIGIFLTGMRFEELASLKWQRINLEKRLIEVRSDATFTTKTESSERDIPMSNFLFNMLTKMDKNTEYVFASGTNTKLTERKLLRICKEIAKEAGITKNATLHKFRHSFSSHLEQLGVSEAVRGYLMGHKPKTMTGHYTKIDPSKLHEHVSKLDSILFNEPTEK